MSRQCRGILSNSHLEGSGGSVHPYAPPIIDLECRGFIRLAGRSSVMLHHRVDNRLHVRIPAGVDGRYQEGVLTQSRCICGTATLQRAAHRVAHVGVGCSLG